MRKVLKIVAGIGGLLLLVLLSLILLAKNLITPDRIKALVLPKVEQALHRQVTLGEVRIGLLSGIELHDLVVADRDQAEPLLAAEIVKLRYQLLPLFYKKVVVDEIRIESPRISLVRRPDGSLNIADLLVPTAAATEDGEGGTNSETAGFALLVSKITLDDGRVILVDHRIDAATPGRIELAKMELKISDFVPHGTVPLRLRATLNGAPLTIVGQVDLAGKVARGNAELQGLDMTTLAPYYREKLPGQLTGALFDANGAFDVATQRTGFRGQLGLRALNLNLKALPQGALGEMAITAEVDVAIDLDRGVLTLTRTALASGGVQLSISGEVTSLTGAPAADLAIQLPETGLRTLMDTFPGLSGKTTAFEPAGSLRGQLQLKGPLAEAGQLLKSAELVLTGIQATVAGRRPVVDGRLLLSADRLQTDGLQLRLGEEVAQLKVRADNIFGRPLVVNADLDASRFPVEFLTGTGGGAVVPDAVGGGAVSGNMPAGGGAAGEVGPFDLPVQASGTVRIGDGTWQGLTVHDFFAGYAVRDNRLIITRLTGQLSGGIFNNTASIDLHQPGLGYDATINLQGIEMHSLLPALAPKAANSLFGRLNLRGNIAGRGTRWDNASRNLHGDIVLDLVDGKLISPALVKGFASFLQLPGLDEIVFREFRGKARLAEGRADIDSLLLSDQIKLYPQGTLGLDGSLNVAVDARLAPELAARLDQRGKVTRYLTDADGWTQIPLLLSGTLQAPRYGLDSQGVQAQAGKLIEQKLQRELDKLFVKPLKSSIPAEAASGGGDEGKAPPTPVAPPPTPARQLLNESLKSLFKKN